MEEKKFPWFENTTLNQGEYAKNKIQEIEIMNIETTQSIENPKELKL